MIAEEFLQDLPEHMDIQVNAREYSPLVLAYVGDAVYEMFVRTKVVAQGNAAVNTLHKKAIAYVKAEAQADVLRDMFAELSEKEQDIVKRGRNAKPFTVPKNADVMDYKYATGLECLIGYLYLEKNFERLFEIMEKVIGKRV